KQHQPDRQWVGLRGAAQVHRNLLGPNRSVVADPIADLSADRHVEIVGLGDLEITITSAGGTTCGNYRYRDTSHSPPVPGEWRGRAERVDVQRGGKASHGMPHRQ